MNKIDSIICTMLYTELITVIDVFKFEKCGHINVGTCMWKSST